jgi:hypothetical protein
MERTWTVSGVFGEWQLRVSVRPVEEDEPGIRLSDERLHRALNRFASLDPHFFDVVNLTEALELSDENGVRHAS